MRNHPFANEKLAFVLQRANKKLLAFTTISEDAIVISSESVEL
jgi:hypothetical protein